MLRDLTLACFLLWGLPGFGDELGIEWAVVGNPGNANEVRTGFGGVDYAYRISRHEVSNAQYANFLNDVAIDDSNELFHPLMDIARNGDRGEFVYRVNPGYEDHPVNHASFLNAMRFVNWLANGQPSGNQVSSTTESGVYDIHDGLVETRASGAEFFIPNEHEWFKAAYHDPGIEEGYWVYPTRSNRAPSAGPPGNQVNTANVSSAVGGTTPVGSYPQASSFYGTFDQAGNVWEWTEDLYSSDFRTIRGGAWMNPRSSSSVGLSRRGIHPTIESVGIGFRIAASAELRGDCDGDLLVIASDLACIRSVDERDFVLSQLNTLAGDLDGNGDVSFDDFLKLAANFETELTSYADGNVDLENGINFNDFLLLAGNFGKTPGEVAAVPEPGMFAMIISSMLMTSLRKRGSSDSSTT